MPHSPWSAWALNFGLPSTPITNSRNLCGGTRCCWPEVDTIVISDDDCVMKYPGGKGKCFQRLINLIPNHTTYIESHLGGGAVLRHKRPAQVSIGVDRDPLVIDRWRQNYPTACQLVTEDAATFLARYKFLGKEFIYADPPYLPETRRRSRVYRFEYDKQQHEELLELLQSLTCMVMISGYDSPTYNTALRSWRKETFRAKTHRDVREECVWLNFDPPTQLHDASYLGDGFRDRQSIRRRHARALERFGRMDEIERRALIGALNARYCTNLERT